MRHLNENCLLGNNSTLQATATPSDMGQIFSYNGNNVRMKKLNGYVLICLTDFAKSFPEKNLSTIINSKEITDYVGRLSEIKNFSSLDLLKVVKGNRSDGQEQGTWAHQKVALRVAQKLSTDFAIWVDEKIEELMTTGVATVSNDDEAIAYAMQVLNNRLEQARQEKAMLEQQNNYLSNEIRQQAPKVKYVDDVLRSARTYTSTQMAKELDMKTAEQLHKKLKEKGVMFYQSGQWMLTATHCGKGYTRPRTTAFTRSDGSQGTNTITTWTETGRLFLHQLFEALQEVRP